MTRSSGASVARGPAALVGGVLLAFGLAALVHHNQFPPITRAFPRGTPHGSDFLGIEVNGWTAWLSAVSGSIVLFGSGQHALAKLVSLLGGLALAGSALLGIVNGSVLGLAATNTITELGLAAAATVLLLTAFAPRVRRTGATAPTTAATTTAPARPTAVPAAPRLAAAGGVLADNPSGDPSAAPTEAHDTRPLRPVAG
jgi:hypothetical protein